MNAIDPTCGGLLCPMPGREDEPALREESASEWSTRAEVRRRALRIAAELAGPRKGLVFLLVSNRLATVTALLGAAAAGHAVALIDQTLGASKMRALIDAYDPDFVVSAEPVADFAGAPIAGEEIWLSRRNTRDDATIAPELLLLLSTSGTTGSSKFVRLSHGAVTANARQIASSLGITPDDCGIAHLPLHYSYGVSVLTSHFSAGARIFLMDDAVTSTSFWPKVSEAGGTHFPGVPFHYTVLGRLGVGQVPPTVTTFTQAGGALDVRLQEKLQRQIAERGGRFFVMYGQTEASPRMTTLPSVHLPRKLGSVGIALNQARLEIRDAEGRILPANESGSVHFHGPNVMLGYSTVRADLARGDELHGHLDTGDVGYLDEDGYLFLTGRTKRFAKIGGLRLGLDEIEAQLAPLANVAAIDGGNKITLFYEDGREAQLKAKLKEMTAEYKILPSSFLLRPVDALPRKGSGKSIMPGSRTY